MTIEEEIETLEDTYPNKKQIVMGKSPNAAEAFGMAMDALRSKQKSESKTQSNADRIRTMTNEELADIIMCPRESYDFNECSSAVCKDCCLDWLKQPYEGGGTK
jgi:hypothetical protein